MAHAVFYAFSCFQEPPSELWLLFVICSKLYVQYNRVCLINSTDSRLCRSFVGHSTDTKYKNYFTMSYTQSDILYVLQVYKVWELSILYLWDSRWACDAHKKWQKWFSRKQYSSKQNKANSYWNSKAKMPKIQLK